MQLNTEHAAFMQSILEDPDSDGPRLRYADYLEELAADEDHPLYLRGQFIRVQCALAEFPVGASDFTHPLFGEHGRLSVFERELQERLGRIGFDGVDLGHLHIFPANTFRGVHRRGFIDEVWTEQLFEHFQIGSMERWEFPREVAYCIRAFPVRRVQFQPFGILEITNTLPVKCEYPWGANFDFTPRRGHFFVSRGGDKAVHQAWQSRDQMVAALPHWLSQEILNSRPLESVGIRFPASLSQLPSDAPNYAAQHEALEDFRETIHRQLGMTDEEAARVRRENAITRRREIQREAEMEAMLPPDESNQ